MPRIRYLKPEFFSDEDLGELSFQTRITFEGLWCYADKEGRLEDRPKFLKAMIFPYDDIDMEVELGLLSQAKSNGMPFIQRYKNGNGKYIQIIQWQKHQKPHHTEKESIFPPPTKILPIYENGLPEFIRQENLFFGDVPDDLIELSHKLFPTEKADEWHNYVEEKIKNLGYKTRREVSCPIDEDRNGRIDLLAEKGNLKIAIELDYRVPRTKSIKKVKNYACGMILLRDPKIKRKEPKEKEDKIKIKIKGMEKQLKASTELSNGDVTVKPRLRKEMFDLFYKTYPKHKSPGNAEKAFKKLNPNKEVLDKILKAIEKAKKSNDWLKDNGKFIPYPATWLNAKGWEDEDVELTMADVHGTLMACKKCGDSGQYAGIDESGLCTSCRIK